MRMLALLLLALTIVGCAGRSHPATELTFVALNPSVGRAEFQLSCDPAAGDVPHVVRSCRAIAGDPRLVSSPKPYTCAGGTFSWWKITISGRLNGKPLTRKVSTCWTPQMNTIGRLGLSWQVLQQHVVPRRHEALMPGTAKVFRSGDLRPTDLVTCDILGRHLEVGVPIEQGQPSSNGYSGTDVVPVTLEVTHNADGSVSASCRRGASPTWIFVATKRMARSLGDPAATVESVTLGRFPVVVLAGSFTCNMCSTPPGGAAPTGRYAAARYDAVTHQSIDFGLAKTLTGAVGSLCGGSPCVRRQAFLDSAFRGSVRATRSTIALEGRIARSGCPSRR